MERMALSRCIFSNASSYVNIGCIFECQNGQTTNINQPVVTMNAKIGDHEDVRLLIHSH